MRMAAATNPHQPPGNQLLAALPRKDLARLRPQLETVTLGLKERIYEPHRPIPYIYFPNTGVTSILTIMKDGKATEVGMVGKEGMLGLPVFLGTDRSSGQSFSQVPGESLRLAADAFRAALRRSRALVDLLHRYTQALFTQVSQSAACNSLHPIEKRCARWLLMTHERVEIDEFVLTQELLAMMLGVRRASVAAVAGKLQDAGLIRYRRGRLRVLDRRGLEAASCECYGLIRSEYERLLPYLAPARAS
jgi:CRP-like cAMP-binding protein